MTRNEAAERLRLASLVARHGLVEAFAAERRATVARIGEQLALHPAPNGTVSVEFVRRILEEEAAR